jgi:hypothetical protein
MSNTNALDYFHVLLAAYEALQEETSPAELQEITEKLRAMNSAQPMLIALDAKIRQMRTVRDSASDALQSAKLKPSSRHAH